MQRSCDFSRFFFHDLGFNTQKTVTYTLKNKKNIKTVLILTYSSTVTYTKLLNHYEKTNFIDIY